MLGSKSACEAKAAMEQIEEAKSGEGMLNGSQHCGEAYHH